ncbi:hypothetical protein CSW64_14560 [Caulobacter mirabilis]|uniref:Uncharacterized protein n=2 Tax=Caulobacter mirabilis TaxID=69666 RepID=A0A2D2AZV0_9CAUL|nr:hypothetical protein CSW64_14560 [Caulobacter mirabilis]
MREAVRAHRWREVAEGLARRPDLIGVVDERGRNWLHLACMTPGEDEASLRTADVLLAVGLGLNDPAFTEGAWRATPLWHVISRGRSVKLAQHLLALGADPDYCLFAAVWNDDHAAIRLLIANGADIEEGADRGDTPLLGAVSWSRFGAAETLLKAGANPDARNAKGETALHMMLRKGSAPEHFGLFARHGARGDMPDAGGRTAADLLRRKRDPAYRAAAERLSAAGRAREP